MRMGIARAHHRATVLENLNVIHKFQRTEFERLTNPHVYHLFDFGRGHLAQRNVMSGRKTSDATNSLFRNYQDKIFTAGVLVLLRHMLLEGGEIIGEYKSGRVLRIAYSPCTQITWTQIAVGGVRRQCLRCAFLNLSLPRPDGAVWRYQNPFSS